MWYAIAVGHKFSENFDQKKWRKEKKGKGGVGWFVTVKLELPHQRADYDAMAQNMWSSQFHNAYDVIYYWKCCGHSTFHILLCLSHSIKKKVFHIWVDSIVGGLHKIHHMLRGDIVH